MESSEDFPMVDSVPNGSDVVSSNVREDSIGVEFLEDFDSYMEDINERLVISRMVSHSVIKGIVNAVQQEAAERITEKQSEISLLKESLSLHQTGTDRNGYSDNVSSLRIVAREQVKKMRKEIDRLRGGSPIRKMASCSELMGLGEILQDKATDSFVVMENCLDDLGTTIDKICVSVEDVLSSSKSSIIEWKHEQELQRELEWFVIQISVNNLQEELDERLNYHCNSYSRNVVEKINEISSLRKDLDEILNTVSNPESHNLDSLYRKLSLDSHTFSSISLGNGVSDESTNGIPDKWNAAQFSHLDKVGLVDRFNTEISNMKRIHETKVQKMTEDYFTLKREYLRQNGSSSQLRKDKELEVLKKKIQEITSRLDDILLENKNLPIVTKEVDSLDRLNDRLKDLTSENRQLRETILRKNKEIAFLSEQVSNASEKMIKLLKSIEDHRYDEEDAFLENLIASEVFKCTLEDIRSLQAIHVTTEELGISLSNEINDSALELLAMQGLCEIIYKEAIKEAESQINELKTRNASEFDHRVRLERIVTEKEDELKSLIHSESEHLAMKERCETIYKESIEEAKSQINELKTINASEFDHRLRLERKVTENEDRLKNLIQEKEDLEERLNLAQVLVEENGKSTFEMSMLLSKEKEQVELAYKEINDLKEKTRLQRSSLSEKSQELDAVKTKLLEVSQQNEAQTLEIRKLKENLESQTLQFTSVNKERQMLLDANQENLEAILLLEAKEGKQREQMDALSVYVSGLSASLAKFEDKIFENIKNASSRLEGLRYAVRPLVQDVKILKRTSFLYKQQLQRKSETLQLAETEVDLLGDEVDVLLGLLNKIYIGLDHYSPILQYYPGIMEILKLIQRELSLQSTKPTS